MSSQDDQAHKPGPGAGTTIGPYRLIELIGEGGMGEVYRAEQTHPIRRTVAVKIIKLGMDTAEFTERFESERQALALMDHPYIARVFDAGATEQGRPYFVMEYVPGVPVTRYCDDQKLDLRARLELFIHVCEGIQHAHQKAIIHRDIKPSNVLVTSENGEVWPKIIDFGVAKTLDQKLTEHTIQTAMGQIMGTPEYMSPEQADLAESHIDTRTDIYLLGELLYILLTGVPPFDPEELKAQGLHAMLYQIRSIDPPRPSQRVAQLADGIDDIAARRATAPARLVQALQGDLDWITMRALEKEQQQRYQTSNDLIQEIRRHLNDEPVLAGPPSTNYRIRKFVKRNRTKVVAAAMVLVALVLGIAGTTIGMIRSIEAEKVARMEAETARQVSEFMVGLFEVSDPGEALGNTITAREILDQGVLRIETELVNQPKTRARLMNTMGRVYKELGLYDDARPLVEQSLGTMRGLGAGNDPATAAIMDNLGGLLRRAGNYDEAREVLVQALALREKELGPEHPETAQSLNSLGNLYWQAGELDKAEELYLRALDIRERKLGPDHLDVAITLNNLGGMRMNAGDFAGAEPAFLRALEIREKALGPIHPDVSLVLQNLGQLKEKMGDFQEARSYFERNLSSREKVYGPYHPRVAEALLVYANMLDETDEYGKSRPMYERVITILEESLGLDHPRLAEALNSLGASLNDQRDYQTSLPLLRRALAIQEKVLGAEHPDVATTLNNLAVCLQNLGDPEAQTLLARALDIQTASLGPEHLDVAVTEFSLGGSYASNYDFPAALPHYQRSLDIRLKHLPADHLLVAESQQGVGTMAMYLGQLEQAEPLLKSALETRRKQLGDQHPDYAVSLADWALYRYYLGQYDRAIPLFREAVAVQEKTLPPNHTFLLSNYYNLACLSSATGERDQAIYYLEKAAGGGFQNPAIMEDPDLAPLHNLPRFKELATAMGG